MTYIAIVLFWHFVLVFLISFHTFKCWNLLHRFLFLLDLHFPFLFMIRHFVEVMFALFCDWRQEGSILILQKQFSRWDWTEFLFMNELRRRVALGTFSLLIFLSLMKVRWSVWSEIHFKISICMISLCASYSFVNKMGNIIKVCVVVIDSNINVLVFIFLRSDWFEEDWRRIWSNSSCSFIVLSIVLHKISESECPFKITVICLSIGKQMKIFIDVCR